MLIFFGGGLVYNGMIGSQYFGTPNFNCLEKLLLFYGKSITVVSQTGDIRKK
tara:strand:- start:32 stop:187 length:156 start_codon:yes stop_codon:yes gene_type:complete